MSPAERIVAPADLPPHLYAGSSSLLLFPGALKDAYRNVLQAAGQLPAALTAAHQGEIGGATAQAAAQHFASAFSGSCARLKLALLDPKEELEEASNLFFRSFAGGRVGLLDIPCGAGAASAALLSTLAELRRAEVIPALPLDVYLVAGDISPDALDYARRVFAAMDADLARQGIFLHPIFQQWDLCDAVSTTELLHTWMEHARDCREYFLLTANCSGFLQHGGNFNQAREQLEELFRWAACRRSTVAWIEPQTNAAMRAMWPRLFAKLFSKLFARFQPAAPAIAQQQPLCSDANFEHPLRTGSRHPVRVSLTKMTRHAP